MSLSQSRTVGETDSRSDAIFRSSDNNEISTATALQVNRMFGEYSQFGLKVPYIVRERQIGETNAQSAGLGDISVFGAYELWPLKTYSSWKPRGFILGQIEAPTSPSVHDFNMRLGEDIRGQGFWRLSVGTFFARHWREYDASLRAEVKQALPRRFKTSLGHSRDIRPGPVLETSIGVGYSPNSLNKLRLGVALGPQYTAAKVFSDSLASQEQLVWNFSFSGGWLIRQDQSLSVTYSDQTLWGPSYNSALIRTLMLQYEWRELL